MNEHSPIIETRPAATAATPLRGRLNLLWLLAPLAVLGLAIAWLYSANPLSGFDNGAPPVESLTVERTILDQDGLRLLVRAGGSEPMSIAQVQVDAAYWQFTQDPAGPIARGDTAWISVPFPMGAGRSPPCDVRHRHGRDLRARDCRRRADAGGDVSKPRLAGAARRLCRDPSRRGRPDVLSGAARRRAGDDEFPAGNDHRPARVPAGRHDRRGAGVRGRIGGHLPGLGNGRACRRGELPPPDGRGATAGASRPDWRSQPTSPSASAFTISAKAWRSARPSRRALPGSAPSL